MQSIYSRFLITLLATIFAMVLISIGVAFRVVDQWYTSFYEDNLAPSEKVLTIGSIFSSEGRQAVEQWLTDRNNFADGFVIFLIDENGKDILGRTIPSFISRELLLRHSDENTTDSGYHLGIRPKVVGADGESYMVFPAPHYIPLSQVIRFQDPRWLIFIFALLIGSLICFLLTRSLTKRLHRLTESAEALSQGHLDARVHLRNVDEIGALGLQFDRMASRIEELISSRQKMFRNLSHEMRSPMARMQIAVDLLEDSPEDPSPQIERIRHESQVQKVLLEQIIEFAMLEDPEGYYEFNPIDLIEVIDIIFHDAKFEANAQNKDVLLEMAMERLLIKGNQELLSSAIENVIRNAIRFTSKHSNVTIKVNQISQDSVKIVVEDEGLGVPANEIDEIFEPFRRGSVKDASGSGIGLSISKLAIKKMGGSIAAHNLTSGGLAVTIILPTI